MPHRTRANNFQQIQQLQSTNYNTPKYTHTNNTLHMITFLIIFDIKFDIRRKQRSTMRKNICVCVWEIDNNNNNDIIKKRKE